MLAKCSIELSCHLSSWYFGVIRDFMDMGILVVAAGAPRIEVTWPVEGAA